ncbi:DMT family transporter [Azospirillum sp. B510]|uniref:DMT family transporter n=1 Tax=Azospirillum sp. (strain B510) TaxID=137722 RepID=UPI0002F48EB5|nr:DMT family transporter [Azospirillum sp. B510]
MRGALAAACAAFCWGGATVLSKSALDEVTPIALLVLQLSASVVVLWSVILLTRRPVPPWRNCRVITLLGLLEPGAAYLLGLIGLVSIRAGDATLIQAFEAIMIVVLSACLLKVRPTAGFVLLSAVALAGLAVTLGAFGPRDGAGSPFGIAMVFLATAGAALYVVLSSRLLVDHDPIVVVGLQQLSALALALAALPFEMLWGGTGTVLPTSAGSWGITIASGVIQYALAFSLYMFALSKIPANLAGSFLNLTPVFGLAIAFIALGEALSGIQLASAATTILAVTVIQFQSDAPFRLPGIVRRAGEQLAHRFRSGAAGDDRFRS